jgi:ketosteroid isomerase-like protein
VAGKGGQRVGGELGAAREAGALEPAGAEAVARRFARAMLNRDPRSAAGCFSPGASILTADGTAVSGREAVEAVLRQITSSEQGLEIRIGRTVVAEGVASCTQFWRRGGRGAGNGGYEDATAARLVLARSGGGSWKIVIASPWE